MARPFRYRPPAPPLRPLVRARLLEQMARRWDQRLVTVVAGPGFGKSALLAMAMAPSGEPARGEDRWLACEPADASASHLVGGLATTIGLPASADLDAVFERVWSRAPEPICVVLDDVHEVPDGSEGASVLARLVAELPGNGHVVLASRNPVPVPTARLAASGQLVRLREPDLVLDPDELLGFAQARGVDPELLASTGGWPALAELTASAGADLVLDYLWEEVLASMPEDRAQLLARFAVVGGGGDEVASALADRDVRVDDLVDGLPLVHRSETGAAALHALWVPPLRTLLGPDAADDARRAAAGAHRVHDRPNEAIDLLAEAGDWEQVLHVIRDAAMAPSVFAEAMPTDFGRWRRMLPSWCRDDPVALLAHGIELQRQSPLDAVAPLQAAATAFRARADAAGEVAALLAHGVVLWWMNDQLGLLSLHERLAALAEQGSPGARFADGVGRAAVAHMLGDSAAVFAILDAVEDDSLPGWRSPAQWLRSVAHRRNGDLERSLEALDALDDHPAGTPTIHLEQARLRTLWLAGEVEEVLTRLPLLHQGFVDTDDQFNAAGTCFELAARAAWLGEPERAQVALSLVDPVAEGFSGAMVVAMRGIADAAIAVALGDEEAATACIHDDAIAAIGQPDGWYWRDRGAVALVHVLVPETRAAWATEPLGPPHRVGLALAEALEAARAGDLAPTAALRWPAPGVTRASLPLPWLAELVAAGHASGNPPPSGMLDAVGARMRPAVHAVVAGGRSSAPVVTAATTLLGELPAQPGVHLRVAVLGSLDLIRDGEAVVDPALRRQRVKELLCFLVIRRRARREAITDELWPEMDDRGRNLRVTLSYLQQVLEPDRAKGDPPYFLRADGPWLSFEPRDHLTVDAWELDALLGDAERAERAGAPAAALDAYRAALPLWRGEPFPDVPYAPWADLERTRMRLGYASGALRAGELLLAAGAPADARNAAEHAITADPASEPAYRLLVRTHLATDDHAGARLAVDRCRAALAELDLSPSPATEALLPAG